MTNISGGCTRKKNKMKNVNILKRSRPYQENLAVSVHKNTVKNCENY